MGYIVCKKCKKYLKVKKEESLDDFDKCTCGGKLKYVENLDDIKKKPKKKSGLNTVHVSIIIIFLIIVGGVLSYYYAQNQPTEIKLGDFTNLEAAPVNATYIVLGAAYIEVPPNATVVTQVERVIKDIGYNKNVSPDHRPSSYKELVPWMEGNRVAELMKYANVKVIPATNVPVKKINGRWQGPDEKGNFIFEIDPSKINPRQTIFQDPNNAMELITHGFNVLVPEAIKNNAFLVVGCGDTPGKAKAASYLSERGINCYAPCDRFLYSLMPYKGSGVILGSNPIRPLKGEKGAIIGGQPIYFNVNEKIIVQTTTKGYPDQYCDTPHRFFTGLNDKFGLTLNMEVVEANRGETNFVVQKARSTGANVIAVRVLNDKDKKPVEEWLKEDKNHRAILFHSAPYEPGYSLFFEFPYQVTGQDPKPIFIKQASDTQIQKIFNEIRGLWM